MEGQRKGMAPHRRRRAVGLVMLALGALILLLNGAYFGYIAYARQSVDTITVQKPPSLPSVTAESVAAPVEVPNPHPYIPSIPTWPQVWNDSGLYPDEPLEKLAVPTGFRPVDTEDLSNYGRASPTRVRIPAIGLDAEVQGLSIQNLGNSRAYETPKNVVGHIPESANPGNQGNTWLFGHLESFIRGEGAVFRDLPKVYDLLRQGSDVYVILDSAGASFLYQVGEFQKIPREELHLWSSEDRVVTLVTCWPRFKYDERILVTAELVGIQDADPALAPAS